MSIQTKYSIVIACCLLVIAGMMLFNVNREYYFNKDNDYVSISFDKLKEYKVVKYFDVLYRDFIDIPIPVKNGIVLDFEENFNTQDPNSILEIYLKENAIYLLEFYSEDEKIYEKEYQGGIIILDLNEIYSNLSQIKKLYITPHSGNSYGVGYADLISSEADSFLLNPITEEGVVRSQLGDNPYIDDAIRNEAISEPLNAIGAVCFIDEFDEYGFTLSVANIHDRNIILKGIIDGEGNKLVLVNDIEILPSDEVVYYPITQEVSTRGFNINDIYLQYIIDGGTEISLVKANVFPRFDYELYDETNVNRESNISSFDELYVEEDNIYIDGDRLELDENLYIPRGMKLVIRMGQEIILNNYSFIQSRSPVEFRGTEDFPVKVYTEDGTGQGLYVLQADKASYIEYTEFIGLDTPTTGAFRLTGSVTFYESDVTIQHSTFKDNVCEDSLNIVRSDFLVDSSVFVNAPSDCFDGDFTTGIVQNCTFTDIEGDAIDFSGSRVQVENCMISNISDKAISGGEQSEIELINVNVDNAQIALASKDSSIVVGNGIEIKNTKIGYMLYQKKPEYGGGTIWIFDSEFSFDGGIEYIVDKGSVLFIDGIEILDTDIKNQDEIIQKVINGEPIE